MNGRLRVPEVQGRFEQPNNGDVHPPAGTSRDNSN